MNLLNEPMLPAHEPVETVSGVANLAAWESRRRHELAPRIGRRGLALIALATVLAFLAGCHLAHAQCAFTGPSFTNAPAATFAPAVELVNPPQPPPPSDPLPPLFFIPEPSPLWLLAVGLIPLGAYVRFKTRKN